MRRISTVLLSWRREDWIPEHAKSWNRRGSPSKYRIELELVLRPSGSILSSVNTSPWACGSIRTIRLLGRMSSASLDLATFSFQVPNADSAHPGAVSSASIKAIRTWIQCRPAGEEASRDGNKEGVMPLHYLEKKRYSQTNAGNGTRVGGYPPGAGTGARGRRLQAQRAAVRVSTVRGRTASGGPR